MKKRHHGRFGRMAAERKVEVLLELLLAAAAENRTLREVSKCLLDANQFETERGELPRQVEEILDRLLKQPPLAALWERRGLGGEHLKRAAADRLRQSCGLSRETAESLGLLHFPTKGDRT